MEVKSLQALLVKLVDPSSTITKIRKLEQMKKNLATLPDYRLTFNQANGLNAMITLLDDQHPRIVDISVQIIAEYCKHYSIEVFIYRYQLLIKLKIVARSTQSKNGDCLTTIFTTCLTFSSI